jgi:hypothetical protein
LKVLLVEPQYEHPFPHLFLLKAITFWRLQGAEVSWTRGYGIETSDPDLIQMTTPIFSWAVPHSIQQVKFYRERFPKAKLEVGGVMATTHAKVYEDATGIKPFLGVHQGIVNCRPSWEDFPNEKLCRVEMTVGCNVGCGFCIVPKIEGTSVYEVWNWQTHFNPKAETNHVIDNNFSLSVSSIRGFGDRLLSFFQDFKGTFDLNSGVEPQSFSERVADVVCALPIKPIRTALDEVKEADKALRTIEILHQHGFNANQIHVYLLYGWKDDIQDALYRLSLLVPEGKEPLATPFAMRYVPLDWFGERFDYQPPQYTREDYIQFARYVNMMKRRDLHSKDRMTYKDFKEWAKTGINPRRAP